MHHSSPETNIAKSVGYFLEDYEDIHIIKIISLLWSNLSIEIAHNANSSCFQPGTHLNLDNMSDLLRERENNVNNCRNYKKD